MYYLYCQTKFKLARMSNKDSKEVRKNIQPSFINSCKIMKSSLDKLASNLCDKS